MNSENTGKEYATKDISSKVGIASPTVRKYSQALEKAGYNFLKNEKGFRIYSDNDIFVFNEIKNKSKKTAMPVEKIAEEIVFNQRQAIQYEATNDTLRKIPSDSGNKGDIAQYDTRYSELMNKLSKLDMLDDIVEELHEVKETNKALVEQLKRQQEYIENSLNKRDIKLVDSLKSSMRDKELKNQLEEIKTALSEVATSQQKRGFFSRLFNK